jgi:hypothetical protein
MPRVLFEFKVSRRIGWDGDGVEELRRHFKAVCRELAGAPGVARVNVRADLERATLGMEVDVLAGSDFEAEAWARETLSQAIRATGAIHVGLLSEGDEAQMVAPKRRLASLKTPHWLKRHTEVIRP